jgi:hypothetical protein
MKFKLLLLFLFGMVSSWVHSQATLTIGTGADTQTIGGLGTDQFRPIYRSRGSSSFDWNQTLILYKESELNGIGIFPGAVITNFSLYKIDQSTITPGEVAQLDILMGTTTSNSLDVQDNFTNLTAGFVSVFSGTVDNTVITPTAGAIPMPMTSSFTYNGGSLIIAFDWDISAAANPPTVDAGAPSPDGFNWAYDIDPNSTDIQSRGVADGSDVDGDDLDVANTARFQIDLTYTGGMPPTCLRPRNFALVGVTDNSVDLSWTSGGSPNQSSYEIEIVARGAMPTGTPNVSGITGTTATVPGLMPSTLYDAYVVADCGATDGKSVPSGPVLFRTSGPGDDCSTAIPLTLNADCSAPGAVIEQLDLGTKIDLGSFAGCDTTGTNTGAWYEFTTGSIENVTLNTNVNVKYEVFDACAGTSIVCGETLAGSAEIIQNLMLSTNYKMAIWVDGLSMDVVDICLEDGPTCLPVTNLDAINITGDAADLTWTASTTGTATDYDVIVVRTGDDPIAGPIVIDAQNVTSPYSATGLSAITTYDFYVRTNCGSMDESPLSLPFTFGTGCGTAVAPYFEDFELFNAGASGVAIDNGNRCWVDSSVSTYQWQADNSGSTGSTGTGPDQAFSGTTFIYTEASNGANGDVAVVDTPPVDLSQLTSPEMSFYWHMFGNGISQLNVSISSDAGATYTLVETIVGEQQLALTDPWRQEVLDISAFAGQTIQVRFETTKIDPLVGFNYEGDVSIDDFFIGDSTINCYAPILLDVSSITSDGATVTWNAGNANNVDYEIIVLNEGDPIATATPVFTANNVSSPFQLTSLMGNSSYDVYVRSNCSGGSSDVTSLFQFRTLCAPFPAPYFADFENFVAGDVEESQECWTDSSLTVYDWLVDTSGGTATGNTGPDGAFSGSTFVYVDASVFGASDGDVAVLESPDVDTSTLTTPALFFYYHMFGAGISSLDIHVSDDLGATYTLISQIVGEQQTASSDPWKEAVLDLSAYTGSTIRVKFETTRTESAPGAGDSGLGDVSLDNFRIAEAPPCLRPSNLDATNGVFDSVAGTSSIDLSWVAGEPTQNLFDVVIVPQGTPVDGSTTPTNPGLTGTSATISGLTPGLRFDAYVRADCGATDGVSFYTGPVSFRTPGPGDECAEPIDLNVEPDCATATPFNLDLINAIDLGTGFASCAGTGPNFGAWFEFSVGRGQSSVTLNASEATQFALFDACSGTEIRCGDLSATNSADIGDLDPRTDYKLVVWSTSTTTPSVDVCLEEGPTCVAPFDLTVVSAVSDTATVAFTPGETSQDTFNILVFNSGDDPLVNAPVVDATGTVITSAPYEYTTLNVLMTGQFYDFYVQSDCGGGDVSSLSGPVTFEVVPPGANCFAAIPLVVNPDCTDPAASTFFFDPSDRATVPDLRGDVGSCDSGTGNFGLWFEFVAPSTGAIVATFDNLEFAVFDGCNGMELVCSSSTTADTTGVIGDLTPGQTYKIVFWDDGGNNAATNICVEVGPDCDVPLVPPYAEDFSDYVGNVPGECWSEDDGGSAATGPTNASTFPAWTLDDFINDTVRDEASARINLTGTNNVDWLLTPFFDLTAGGYEIVVDAALTDEFNSNQNDFDPDDKVSITYSSDGGVTWNEFYIWDINNQPSETGETYFIPIPSSASSVQFGIVADSGTSNVGNDTDTDFFIDNFRIRTIPSCPDTRDLSIDAFDATTATISFTSGSTSSNGNFEYAVTAPNAGTPTAPTGAWNEPTAVGQANPAITYTIMGLASNTSYDVYVREICGAGDVSAWSLIPVSFTTACDTFTSPYLEDFEAFTVTTSFTIDQCWRNAGTSAYDWEVRDDDTDSSDTGPSGPFNGMRYVVLDASDGSNGDVAILESPFIDLSSLTNPAIYFWYHMYGPGGIAGLDVEVSSDNGITFTNVLSIVGQQQMSETDPWLEAEIDLAAFANQTIVVRFVTVKTSINGGNSYEGDVAIDDFSVQNIITCRQPTNLTLVDAQTSSVDLTWEAGATGQTNFEVIAVLAGAGPNGTIEASATATSVPDAANPFRLPGLQGSTSYDIYVRADCGSGDLSLFTGPLNVLTDCEAVTSYPFVADFTTNLSAATCWEQGEGGTLSAGILVPGDSEWKADDYFDSGANTVASSSLNMFGNSTVDWLITEQFDLNNRVSAQINVTTAVTAFDDATLPSAMGSDDTVVLAYLDVNDPNASWIALDTWDASNTPALNGTPSTYDISSLVGGVYRFAFVGSTNASDPEDFDFHVSQFRVDAAASTQSVGEAVSFTLYPNPVSGSAVNIAIGGNHSNSYNVTVYNAMGQQVISRDIDVVSNTIKLEGVETLSAGMYFVTVKGDNSESTLKFLKN